MEPTNQAKGKMTDKLAKAAGTVEGFVKQAREDHLAQKSKQAIERAGETVRGIAGTAREEGQQVREAASSPSSSSSRTTAETDRSGSWEPPATGPESELLTSWQAPAAGGSGGGGRNAGAGPSTPERPGRSMSGSGAADPAGPTAGLGQGGRGSSTPRTSAGRDTTNPHVDEPDPHAGRTTPRVDTPTPQGAGRAQGIGESISRSHPGMQRRSEGHGRSASGSRAADRLRGTTMETQQPMEDDESMRASPERPTRHRDTKTSVEDAEATQEEFRGR